MSALRLLLALVALAMAVAGAVSGVVCEVLAFGNRRPGLPHYSLMLHRAELTERGWRFHRRGWRAWAVGIAAWIIASVLVPG